MSAAYDKAYNALRERIFSGTLPAGTRLKERDICCELDVSRTPVREALRRLAADGLVTIEPRRGAVVAGISADESAEVFQLGMLLEGFAARLAAQNATADGLATLHTLLADMDAVLSAQSATMRSEYLELDRRLHSQIVAMTGNRHLARTTQEVVGLPVLISAFTHYSPPQLDESLRQHRAIVAAIEAGDGIWAEAAMRAHILSGQALSRQD